MFADLCLLQLGVGVVQRVEASDAAELPPAHSTTSHSKDLSSVLLTLRNLLQALPEVRDAHSFSPQSNPLAPCSTL